MRRPSGAERPRSRERGRIPRPGAAPPSPPDHGGRLPVALLVPGDEGMGLSALGWQAVYRLLVREPEIAVERFFLGKGFLAPTSADSGRDLRLFPLMAASVSFEEDFLPLLRTLAATGVPSLRAERPDYPLVLVGGPVDAETGMVVNLVDVDEAVRTRVTERFDHTNLNLDPLFANSVPTTENLCRVVFGLLKDAMPVGELEAVRVEETENNFFEYRKTGKRE